MGINPTARELLGFRRWVQRVVTDPKGWQMYGVQFQKQGEVGKSNNHVSLSLVSSEFIAQQCGWGHLSCYQSGEKGRGQIYINLHNWRTGGDSGMPLSLNIDDTSSITN